MAKLEPLSQKWVKEFEEKVEILKGVGIFDYIPASHGKKNWFAWEPWEIMKKKVARAWDVDPRSEEAEMV